MSKCTREVETEWSRLLNHLQRWKTIYRTLKKWSRPIRGTFMINHPMRITPRAHKCHSSVSLSLLRKNFGARRWIPYPKSTLVPPSLISCERSITRSASRYDRSRVSSSFRYCLFLFPCFRLSENPPSSLWELLLWNYLGPFVPKRRLIRDTKDARCISLYILRKWRALHPHLQ